MNLEGIVGLIVLSGVLLALGYMVKFVKRQKEDLKREVEDVQHILTNTLEKHFSSSQKRSSSLEKPEEVHEVNPAALPQEIFLKINDNRNMEAEIKFSKVLNPIPKENYVSAVTGAALQTVVSTIPYMTGKMYEASVSPAMLAKFHDGLTSTMVKGANGQIMRQAGFSPVEISKVLTPIAAFQVTSFITGQYYLNIIKNNLDRISSMLDKLIRWEKQDKLAELKSIFEGIKRLEKLKNPQIEHLVLLNQWDNQLRQLLYYHIEEVKYLAPNSQVEKTLFQKDQLDSTVDTLKSDDFCSQIQMISSIEEMQFYIRITNLMANIKLAKMDGNNRVGYIQELVEDIIKYPCKTPFVEGIGHKLIDQYYGKILDVIEEKGFFKQLSLGKTKEETLKLKEKIGKKRKELKSSNLIGEYCKFQKQLESFWNATYKVIYIPDMKEDNCFICKE